jgi:autotransporter-associated beta strand protein
MFCKSGLLATVLRGVAMLLLIGAWPATRAQRLLGLDISAWQGNISQTTWNNLRNVENRQFVFIRSSRGGTTGVYDQNDASNANGQNTLSQRYDDPYFVQNINRATAAGIFAGPYHFSRPDIVESTLNSGGVRNSGADDADHFIQMAGPWMRPGYLVPIHDFEAGDGIRSDNEMAQFCIDFSNRIFEKTGIRPGIYINGNYSANILQTASTALRDQIAKPAAARPSVFAPCYPVLWDARWPNQTNPDAVDVQGTNPKDTFSGFYGPWDDYGDANPWTFWQYASTGHLQSFNGGSGALDFDATHGDVESLKDSLVPAVWMNDSSGDWSALANWNSGQTPIAPVTGAGQGTPVGTQTLPIARLPGATGSGVTSGQNDTVILERTNANITVTLSSGVHNIRKLYMREALNITGGSLAINYNPKYASNPAYPNAVRSGALSAQFSGPVTLSGAATLTVHTLQVDATRVFTLAGGALTLNTLSLMPGTTAAKLSINGDVTINAIDSSTAAIIKGVGSGSSGSIDLAGGERTLTIGDGSADVDLSIDVSMANGALTKAGAGTLRVTSANSYAGGTTISAGRLLVNGTSGTGPVIVNGGTLGGVGTIPGAVTVNQNGILAPGNPASIGALTLTSVPTLAGTVLTRIDRNGAQADKLILTAGALPFNGALIISNIGAPLVGGEVFAVFSASSYAGSFSDLVLPALSSGLNWDTTSLAVNGTLKVNRSPVANGVIVTNFPPAALEIPLASLLAKATDPDGDAVVIQTFDLTSTIGIKLTTNTTSLFYSNYVNVPDRFGYVVTDGHGGVATGSVFITNSPAARFESPPALTASGLTLHFLGRPGLTYYLDRSTELPFWVTISTNVAPANGLFDYTDPNPPNPAAFYQLHSSQ